MSALKKMLKIGLNDCGQRLNKFVEKTFPTFPKSAIYKAIRTKKIKINGKRSDASYVLNFGDVFEIFGFDKFVKKTKVVDSRQLSQNQNIDVVYEDENLLVVNKPIGLVSHPCGRESDSLISRILAYLIKNGEFVPEKENSFKPGICNRLDANTSGLIVAAKNCNALRCLNELFRERRIIKTYFCEAEGVFNKTTGVLTHWLAKDKVNRKAIVRDEVFENSKQAVLEYYIIKQFSNFAAVKIVLHTGRFHQIRAQLAYEGHPLCGDVKYGGQTKNGRKMNLCADGLIFNTRGTIFDYLDGKEIKLCKIK